MKQNYHALAGHTHAPALPTVSLLGQLLRKRWDGTGCGNRADRCDAVRETVSTLTPHASQAGDCVLAGRMQPSRLARLCKTMRKYNGFISGTRHCTTNLLKRIGDYNSESPVQGRSANSMPLACSCITDRGITCNNDAVSHFTLSGDSEKRQGKTETASRRVETCTLKLRRTPPAKTVRRCRPSRSP